MRNRNWLSLTVAACLLSSCTPSAVSSSPESVGRPGRIEEASGVLVLENELLIVDDSKHNSYFRVPIPQDAGPLITLNDQSPRSVTMPVLNFVDLESIARLNDGRIVALSERMRGLVGKDGPIVEYDYPLSEVARRGLEGVAVRALPDGASRVAVIWEGGYPDPGSLHPQLAERVGPEPFDPIIFVHDIAAGASPGRVRWREGLQKMILQVPIPEGRVPEAQRFRAPALEWYRWPDKSQQEWGFLVMLSSQNAVDPPRFLHHLIQRFDSEGKRVGDPIDIAAHAPAEIGHANWEGMHWWKPGKSLILVHEGRGDIEAHALILELPETWQY
jgi:hypothetical protein